MTPIPAVDAHSDALMDVAHRRLQGERQVIARRYVPELQAGGVGVQFLMVGGDFPLFAGDFPQVDHLRQSLALLEAFHSECEESPGLVRAIRTREDALAILRGEDRAMGFVLHWEGVGAAESLSVLRLAWRLGLRSAGLTWNGAGQAGDGSSVRRNAGLTEYGRLVIEEMNRLGIVVDVSHLSDRGVAEVCEVSTRPVIASHSNARAVFDHPRNLADEHVRMIADSGGVIGVCAYPVMLTERERPRIAHLVEHVEYLCELVGPRHVGIGCDFTKGVSELMSNSAYMRPYRDDLLRPFPVGFETVRDVPALRAGLSDAGIGPEDVDAIMGGNFLRILCECLPGEDGLPAVASAGLAARRSRANATEEVS